MKKIRTVTGDISPDELGFTSMHEHIIMNFTGALQSNGGKPFPVPENRKEFSLENMVYIRANAFGYIDAIKNENEELLAKELEAFKMCGGKSIVECSTIDMRGDVRMLKRLSEKTGVQIIFPTGFGKTITLTEEMRALTEDQRYECMMNEIENGAENTGIKPGFVKTLPEFLDADGNIGEQDMINFRAAARVAAETGMPWLCHALPVLSGDQVVSLVKTAVEQYKVDPGKMVICHQDHCAAWTNVADWIRGKAQRTYDFGRVERLVDIGVNVGVDTFGCQMFYDGGDYLAADDYSRLVLIGHLIDSGYEDQIVLGHDLFPSVEGVSVGMAGYTRISEFVLPTLKQAGFDDATVNKLVIDNPKRIMAF